MEKHSWSFVGLVVASVGLGSFIYRACFIVLAQRQHASGLFEQFLKYIPASVLAAIVAPLLILHQGSTPWLLGKERLLCAILAGLVAYKTKNLFATIASGLAFLYLFQWLA